MLAGRPRFTVRPMGARIRLCGRLEVELGGERVEGRLPGRQGPLVLALLVVNRERPVGRDELIDALWPAAPPSDPDEALSALLSKVRQAVGREILTGRRDLTLTLPEDAEVDLELALASSERAQAAIADGDVATAWEEAETVLEMSGRGFLVGLDAPWVEDRRRELEELRLRALEVAAESGVALGGARLARAERAARELVRVAPLREAGHRLLMEALAARGELGEALAAYEQLRVTLRDELGTTPGAAVRTLHERLLAGESPPPASAPSAAAAAGAAAGAPGPRARRVRGPRAGARAPASAPGRPLARGAGDLCSWQAGRASARPAWPASWRATAQGGTVLYGACQEEALVAYEPFVEALRHYARARSLDGDARPARPRRRRSWRG